jgi:hypothetical protein
LEQTVAFVCQTGEEVRAGDQITYAGSPGEVEFAVTEATGDPVWIGT